MFSRYLAFMSLPVSYMVSITLSKVTRGFVVRRNAIRLALIAFTEAIALRSIQGTCTCPPTGRKLSPDYVPSQFQLQYTLVLVYRLGFQLNLLRPLNMPHPLHLGSQLLHQNRRIHLIKENQSYLQPISSVQ